MTRMLRPLIVLSTALVVLAGCHRDPNLRANDAIARGDAYAQRHQLREAIIEYGRAVQFVPDRVDAHMKLAQAYRNAGDSGRAYAEYMRAIDLDPSRVEAHVEAGNLLLESGDFEQARSRANAALAVDSRSVRAHILLGNALAGLHDTTQATRQMEQAVALDPASPDAYTALGAIQFAAASPAAKASFEKAVALQPRSIDPRIALANYDWVVQDHAGAEQALKDALTIDPANESVHRALALMYLAEKRTQEAEPHFKALASQSASGRLALADFYSGLGRLDEALTVLRGLEGDRKLGRAARVRIAGVLHQQGKRDEALKLADELVRSRPSDVDGHVLKARLLLTAPVDVEAAWTEATAAVKADRDSAPAQYTLGLAAMARRDYDAADKAFTKTLALNPRAALANLQLARVRLARGDTVSAQNAAEEAVGARPDDPDATLMLARTLRANGELDRARRELSARLERVPSAVPMWVELGHVELAAHRPGEARAALDRALAQSPEDVGAQVLAARLDIETGNGPAAEQRLLEIVRAHSDRLDAYELLATYYISRGQIADALTKYRLLAARVPEQPGPATMIGILLDAANDHAGARAQYEAVLARHPRAGVAANNLAWMLAEDGRFDDALHWATIAAETLRGRAEPQDTLGWIYLKTDHPRDALAAFSRAISAAPHQPLYAQHAADARRALANR